MHWTRFLIGFLIVVLAYYGKAQLSQYWVPIEFSFFLIFLIVRSSGPERAMIMTAILSLSLDLIFQTGQTKGLSAMGQVFMIFVLTQARRFVIPLYNDLFLIGAFALFFFGNYYITMKLSQLLDVYFQTIRFTNLVFIGLFHTVLFGVVLAVAVRFKRERT